MKERKILAFPTKTQVPDDAQFQPARLTLARTRRGMTKTDLSALTGLSVNSLSAYEKGDTEPRTESVELLANATRFPFAFFYEEHTELVEPKAVSFRALSRMPARHRDMVTGAAGLAATKLEPWIGERFGWPDPDIPDFCELAPAAAAEALRSEWGLGNDGIPNLVRLLESKGVRIFSLGFGRGREEFDAIDALSTWVSDLPFIFTNGGVTPERMRFNISHELAHLVLHKQGHPSGQRAESEANEFAGHFLIPGDGLRAEANRFASLSEIIELKKRWGVSALAYVYRMHEESILDSWRYRELCVRLRRNYGRDEPESIGCHETSFILQQVFAGIDQGLGRGQVAADLLMGLEDLHDMVFAHVITSVDGFQDGPDGMLRIE